jgi:hypothetical protein
VKPHEHAALWIMIAMLAAIFLYGGFVLLL